jgi:hypothetical protein
MNTMAGILMIALSSTAMSKTILERNNYEPIPHADEPAGCKVIVDAVNANRDIAGAIAGGIIGGGSSLRSLAGIAIGAYMSRPSGSGRTGP